MARDGPAVLDGTLIVTQHRNERFRYNMVEVSAMSFSEVACTSGPVFSGVVQSAVERWPFSSRVH